MTSLFALFGLLAVGTPAQEPPTFRSALKEVYLDVFVTREDQPVRGLTAENFVVHDDGVPQRVRLVDPGDAEIRIIEIYDAGVTGSGQGVAIMSDVPRHARSWRPDKSWLILPGASLYEATWAARLPTNGDARRLVILLFNADKTTSRLSEDQVLEELARSDALLQVVWVGKKKARVRVPWLREIAGWTGGRNWTVESWDQLFHVPTQIREEMALRYVLAFEPRDATHKGVHDLDVELVGAEGEVRARKHYVAR